MPLIPISTKLLLKSISSLAIQQTAVFILVRVICARYEITLPGWAFFLIQAVSFPIIFACRVYLEEWRHARKAAQWGAILPPRLNGKWIGNYDRLLELLNHFDNGYMGDGLTEWLDDFKGYFNLWVLWENSYVTSDVNVVKTMLATDFSNFEKGDAFQNFMHSVLGTGVFNSDGDMWKFHRSMTRPFFSRERISHFELFDKHADEAIKKMKDRFRAGYALDFQDLIARYTLDAATEFLFGSCVHSLGSDLPYPSHPQAPVVPSPTTRSASDEFAVAFLEAQEALAVRGRIGWSWPWFEIFKNRTKKPMRVVDAYLEPILKEAVRKAEAEKRLSPNESKGSTDDEHETLLDHLVKFTTDPVVLHDETLNILIAGRDTTAASLTFAVYFLCVYPKVRERLRKEILEVVGPSRRPTPEDFREMKYLRAVINGKPCALILLKVTQANLSDLAETLRLYPAVPFNVRCAKQDTTFSNPNGKPFFVPANTFVTYSVFVMHRRKDYWGPDALEFDPDRFIDERVAKYLIPNPFIFLPFNAGPRICLGQQYAYNEMSFFLVRLLQNFSSMSLDIRSQPPESRPPGHWKEFSGRKGIEEFNPKSHLTSYAMGGLWLKMDEAEGTDGA